MTIEYLLKKCMTEELPCGSFFSNEGIHANLSREKPFLFCVNEEIYIRFRKFSERTNVEWNFIFFSFASQCKLCGLLSYGEYSHLFISVVCFVKTTHLSVHRFNSLIFFSCRIKSTHIIFLLLKNTDHSNRVLKTMKNKYLNKFQSKESLPWDWLWKSTKLENCTKPLCKGFVKNESVRIKHLGKWKFSTPLQILHAVRHSWGMSKHALFKGGSTLVAMVTTAACSRPGPHFHTKIALIIALKIRKKISYTFISSVDLDSYPFHRFWVPHLVSWEFEQPEVLWRYTVILVCHLKHVEVGWSTRNYPHTGHLS